MFFPDNTSSTMLMSEYMESIIVTHAMTSAVTVGWCKSKPVLKASDFSAWN